MLGSGMFNFLNKRLQQIMGSKAIFGGVSLIAVGYLFQLKPVLISGYLKMEATATVLLPAISGANILQCLS